MKAWNRTWKIKIDSEEGSIKTINDDFWVEFNVVSGSRNEDTSTIKIWNLSDYTIGKIEPDHDVTLIAGYKDEIKNAIFFGKISQLETVRNNSEKVLKLRCKSSGPEKTYIYYSPKAEKTSIYNVISELSSSVGINVEYLSNTLKDIKVPKNYVLYGKFSDALDELKEFAETESSYKYKWNISGKNITFKREAEESQESIPATDLIYNKTTEVNVSDNPSSLSEEAPKAGGTGSVEKDEEGNPTETTKEKRRVYTIPLHPQAAINKKIKIKDVEFTPTKVEHIHNSDEFITKVSKAV